MNSFSSHFLVINIVFTIACSKQYLVPALQPAHLPIVAPTRAVQRTVPSPGIIPGQLIPSPSSSSPIFPPPPPYRAIKTPWYPRRTATPPRCASPPRSTRSTPRRRQRSSSSSSTRCSPCCRPVTARSSAIRDRRTPPVPRNRLPGWLRLATMPSRLPVNVGS